MSSLPTSTIAPDAPVRQHWTLDSIDWRAIRRDAVAGNEALFYLIAGASFVEATTDLYTQNLIDFFSADDEITGWLREHWLPEELQHGHALRRYVQLAWPDFDWDGVYEGFLPEFAAQCAEDGVEPTRTREMASRCIVEMGTAGYYRTLSRMTDDPLLSAITQRIADDEVRHYKHFYRYLRKYRRREGQRRPGIVGAVWNRIKMIDGEDSRMATRHIYCARNNGRSLDEREMKAMRRRWRALIEPHFPYRMCMQMLLKPLELGPRTHRLALPLCEAVARRLVP